MKKIEVFSYSTMIYFLIRGSFLGILTHNLFFTSRGSSWISILLAIFFGILPLKIFYKIMEKHPDLNFFQILEFKFKNYGKILSYLLITFVFIFACFVFWNLLNFIGSQFLHKTPNIAIGFIIFLSLINLLNKGINVISRVSVILFFTSLTLYVLCFFGLFFQIKPILLLPIFSDSLFNIGLGSLNFLVYSILPIFFLGIVPFNRINNKKEIVKKSFIIYLISTVTLFFVIFLVLGIYGIEFSQLLQYTEYHILKRFSIVGTIDRTENIFALQWIIDIYMFLVISIYYVGEKIKIKSKYKYTIICFLMLLISTKTLINSTVINSFLVNYFPFIILLFLFILPLFIYKKN